MASIEFYFMAESPPCQTVALVASLLDIPLNKHGINLFLGDHMKDEYIKLNPSHKVPFIVDGDLKIGESRAIAAYLVNKYGPKDSPLYPACPVARAMVDELLFFDSGTLYPAISQVYRPLLLQGKPLDSTKVDDLYKVYQLLDDRIKSNGNKKFLTGDNMTIADISIMVTINFGSACGVASDKFENMNAYVERVKASIPKYHELIDEPIKNMKSYVASKLAATQEQA